MKRVYKYEIRVADFFALEMPVGAELLRVDAQGNVPCLWAIVDPDAGYPWLAGHYSALLGDLVSLLGQERICRLIDALDSLDDAVDGVKSEEK